MAKRLCLLFLVSIFCPTPLVFGADNTKISPDLQGYTSATPVQVIVQYARGTTVSCNVDQYDIFTVGAGYVDVAAALASTDVATGSALSPTANYDSNTGVVYLTSDPSSIWGTSQAWSGPAVWGSNQFVGGSSIMWGASGPGGSSIMWGASAPAGSSIMWGATGLAGSSIMWGANTSSGFASIWSNSIMWGANANSVE